MCVFNKSRSKTKLVTFATLTADVGNTLAYLMLASE